MLFQPRIRDESYPSVARTLLTGRSGNPNIEIEIQAEAHCPDFVVPAFSFPSRRRQLIWSCVEPVRPLGHPTVF
jgi:hypothetical protein